MNPEFLESEEKRQAAFPVCRDSIFMGHAGVTVLPRVVADAVIDYTRDSCERHQEFGTVLKRLAVAREVAAAVIGAEACEIALLGPTSLGLSLFAQGIEWKTGDEVICYHGDYPANVYPWMDLRRKGVEVKFLEPAFPGEITPELVEQAITEKTRLVALASCHFLTGYRIEIEAIGALLRSRGILFSLDAIQTVGAFPTPVSHVDFLSADAHKWMLGPLSAGMVFVRKERFAELHPILLGAANVKSPNFLAMDEIELPDHASRYEPGVLNCAGIFGMTAALEQYLALGGDWVAARLLELKAQLVEGLLAMDFHIHGPSGGINASGITTFFHPSCDSAALFAAMETAGITGSLRHDRTRQAYLRLSPHYYNTAAEVDRVLAVLHAAIQK